MQLKDLFLTRDVTALLEELTEASRILPEGLTPSTRLLGGPVVDALADLRPEDADVLVCGSRGYGPARPGAPRRRLLTAPRACATAGDCRSANLRSSPLLGLGPAGTSVARHRQVQAYEC